MKTIERTLLTLSGLTGIVAFFLPFLHFKKFILSITFSGMTYVKAGLDLAELDKYPIQREFFQVFLESWQQASMLGMLKHAALAFVLLGPVFFVLHSIGHFFRGLAGGHYQRGIFFVLFYMGVSWAIFHFIGEDYNLAINFFNAVGIGYWLGFGAIVVAALSAFFDNSNSSK